MTKQIKQKPTAWQLDPNNIETERVQYWYQETMLTLLSNSDARTLVANGSAFVITDQAIGAMNSNGTFFK